MKKIIRFSKFFLPAVIISAIIALAGVAGFVYFSHLDADGKFDLSIKGRSGFNLGVDFQAGLIQEVQFAPAAFSITWQGQGNARISFDRAALYIVISGAGVESKTFAFPFSEYENAGALVEALSAQADGLDVTLNEPAADASSQWLVYSAQGNPDLGSEPYLVHYLRPDSEEISIAEVREALTSLEQTISVQRLGQPFDRHFMIRVEDRAAEDGEPAAETGVFSERITGMLEEYFGGGEVVVIRSDYVGSRFSKNLTDQAGLLLGLTLLLILAYASIRFKPQYAIGAVLAIIHDGLIMIAFVVWTRMEFNTSTIAAILTILGYSINDTIVIFDRTVKPAASTLMIRLLMC
jgi:preprotein translocase subunit SecF